MQLIKASPVMIAFMRAKLFTFFHWSTQRSLCPITQIKPVVVCVCVRACVCCHLSWCVWWVKKIKIRTSILIININYISIVGMWGTVSITHTAIGKEKSTFKVAKSFKKLTVLSWITNLGRWLAHFLGSPNATTRATYIPTLRAFPPIAYL